MSVTQQSHSRETELKIDVFDLTYHRVLVVDIGSVFKKLVDDIDVTFSSSTLNRSG